MTESEPAIDSGRAVWALGRYLIIAELGRGGMAEVYLAVARGPSGFSKLVVLKLLRAQFAEEEAFLEMFLAEARVAARLNHANVVQTYEVAVEGGRQCIVMEYLEGRTLAETWQGAPMPLPLSVRVLCDALAGLHHAHELLDIDGKPCGLVHRDVSPQNVIVTYDGQVKVVDFGIAKANDSASQTRTGVFKGKVRYAAPERIVGGEIDRRADVFSVGVLLWEAVTRQRLWSGLGDLAVMHRLASGEHVPPPSTVDPTLPAAIDVICARALARSPSERYATAREMQDALEEFLESSSSVPITGRAVAKFMSDTFAEARERFQRTVDEQLRLVAHARPEELPLSMSRIRAGAPHLGAALDPSSVSWMPVAGTNPPALPSAPMPQPHPLRRVAITAVALLGAAVAIAALRGGGPEATRGQPGTMAAPESTTPAPIALPAPSAALPAGDAPMPSDVASATPVPSPAHRAWTPPPRVVPRAATAPAPVAPAAEPRRELDCSSPYYIDDRGLKKVRAECL